MISADRIVVSRLLCSLGESGSMFGIALTDSFTQHHLSADIGAWPKRESDIMYRTLCSGLFVVCMIPPRVCGRRTLLLLAVCWLVSCSLSWSQLPGMMATQDRVQSSSWWPTKGTPARDQYVDSAVCAQCHAARAAVQKTTAMARAATAPADSDILRLYRSLSFHSGNYTYNIEQKDGSALYSVTDGAHSLSVPIMWEFGLGKVGQAYLYEKDGAFYEGSVSYFGGLQKLGFALGSEAGLNLSDAQGRRIETPEGQACFGCHTTASTTSNRFDPDQLIPGVTCEACHGPGAKHVAAMKTGDIELGTYSIFKPAQLSALDQVEFCGACHRTLWDTILQNARGVFNVRFQAYRLERSECFRNRKSRITCVNCHDPHQPLAHDAASYDTHCLNCHLTRGLKPVADHPGRACPVAASNCVICHMPKVEIPGIYFKFTDHWIRIARKGEPYPD